MKKVVVCNAFLLLAFVLARCTLEVCQWTVLRNTNSLDLTITVLLCVAMTLCARLLSTVCFAVKE